MKATILATAALTAMCALPAAAQQPQPSGQQVAAQSLNLPAGGIVLDFKEIDKNNDRSISVEEWNEFIAALRARTERSSSGGAATGATGSSREQKR
jgi:hypothetical protein